MIKLQDFARECGVTDRAIQKHLKNHEEALAGHFERRGKNGTWLDEEAQSYIKSLMQQQPIVVGDSEIYRKHIELQQSHEELRDKYEQALEALNAAKDMIIELKESQAMLEAAELKQQLLEERQEEARAKIEELQQELEQYKPIWFGLYKKKE